MVEEKGKVRSKVRMREERELMRWFKGPVVTVMENICHLIQGTRQKKE